VVGNVAFNAPERMGFGESRIIALVASPKMDAATLSSELRGRIGGVDPIEVQKLQVAPLMEAQLEGAPAFEITALTPARQPVSRATPTEWRWNARARESGTHALHLTINAIITVDGERFPRSLDVLNREIEVEITAPQRIALFVQANWQWLAGTIVIRWLCGSGRIGELAIGSDGGSCRGPVFAAPCNRSRGFVTWTTVAGHQAVSHSPSLVGTARLSVPEVRSRPQLLLMRLDTPSAAICADSVRCSC
jgi:hypothetical protein